MKNILKGTILFGKYQILETLGKGGFSKVFLATNLKVGNKVAVKVVDKNLYKNQLVAEKNMLIKLRHSSIVVIFDIEEDDDYYYLIEEYVEGETLESVKENLNEKDAKAIFYKLLEVLNFLHTNFEKPIIYRDLKPDNIILMKNGAIKLIDFGIASPLTNKDFSEEENYGTKSYCAPEQICYGTTDVRTDIYSLGVTMYYLLTGKNLSKPPYKIITVRHFRKDISHAFSDIIAKMTQTMAAKRYQSVKDIINDLEDLDSVNKKSLDIDTFAEKGKKVIYVTGVKRGVGTTHICQMIASFYKNLGKKTCIVEWANRGDLIEISGAYEDALETKRYYELKGVRGYFYCSKGFSEIIDDNFDLIIVDSGTYEEFLSKSKNVDSLEVFVVGSSSDWNMRILEDMIFENHKNYTYLINLQKNEELILELTKIFYDIPIFAIPININPYEIENINIKFFEKIFNETYKVITNAGVINEFFKKSKKKYEKITTKFK